MQFDAIAPYLVETHFKIFQVLDGDSFMVQNIFSKKEKEIRLYGLDAPENKRNRKLIEDEKKARVAGDFLIQLGKKSTAFALTIAPPGTNITLITEEKYFFDFYKRQLTYIILSYCLLLNEILIKERFSKPIKEKYYYKLDK